MTRQTIAPARVNPVLIHDAEKRVSLDGKWQFTLDPDDRGAAEEWCLEPEAFAGRAQVPGTWQGQGFGSEELHHRAGIGDGGGGAVKRQT